jgi:hypothetical protein
VGSSIELTLLYIIGLVILDFLKIHGRHTFYRNSNFPPKNKEISRLTGSNIVAHIRLL